LRLRQALEMTCFIAVMGNKGPTVVRIEEPALPAVLNVRVGSVLPLLWSATGRVFLAYLEGSGIDELAREELVHMPPASQAPDGQPDLLQRVRRDVRTAGVATVRDITLAGISAVSVPVFQYTGGLAAVLTVLGATGSFDTGPRGQVAQAALEESAAISAALGGPN
jgi:DNA-binding IclR family transcriptional regulator